MSSLLALNELTEAELKTIWQSIESNSLEPLSARIGWSFEGYGTRTRTTFIQAFQNLGCAYVELPNLLKTGESVADLAGYLDDYYDAYVIRESNHERLTAFANASRRPVINAMSEYSHPCEVIADAYSLNQRFDLSQINILLWGPTTNVLRTWHYMAAVLGIRVSHYCPAAFQEAHPNVDYLTELEGEYDIVITDAWPKGFSDVTYTLTVQHLMGLGNPRWLPVPPVSTGQETTLAPSSSLHFLGYSQKSILLSAHQAILRWCLN